MNIILALRGVANVGKSTSIRNLDGLLQRPISSYTRILHQPHGADFLSIYEDKITQKRIGITSAGDTFDLVNDRLQELLNDNCTICVCAARSYGGTNDAIEAIPNYTKLYFPKTVFLSPNFDAVNSQDASRMDDVNSNDASDMYDVIIQLIK